MLPVARRMDYWTKQSAVKAAKQGCLRWLAGRHQPAQHRLCHKEVDWASLRRPDDAEGGKGERSSSFRLGGRWKSQHLMHLLAL